MEIEFTYGEKEFYKGIRSALLKLKKIRIFDLALFTASFILSFYLDSTLGVILRIVSVIGLSFLVYQLFGYPRKLYKSKEEFKSEYNVYIIEDGLAIINDGLRRDFAFSEFKNIKEDDEFFYFEEESGFVFLPKRAFNSEQLEKMNSILSKYINKDKKKKK